MIVRLLLAVLSLSLVPGQSPSQFKEAANRADKPADQGSTRPSIQKSEGRSISGLVLDDSGQPLEGAQIIVVRIGSRDQIQFVNADDNGKFKTPSLVPGLYAMEVYSPGYIIDRDSAQSGIYRPGEHLTFHLRKGGVITGRVTDASGDPVISVNVIAYRVSDTQGRSVVPDTDMRRTDDRGVYRIYGLEPGRYVVSIKMASGVYAGGSELRDEPPTYYPSSVRGAAVEVSVGVGEEVSGIDIQRRGERGHAISGLVSGDIGSTIDSVSVKLINASSGVIESTAHLHKSLRFAFYGVPDGEYDLYAQSLNNPAGNAGSALRRVVLRGADLIGADLKLIKYGSIAGRVMMDSSKVAPPAPHCEGKSQFQLDEIMLHAGSTTPTTRAQEQFFPTMQYWGAWRGSIVDPKGGFVIQNLEPGRYRLNVNLPGEDWYVRSVTQPAVGVSRKGNEDSRAVIAMKSGAKVVGVEVIMSEGASSLRGSALVNEASSEKGTDSLPRLQIHLVPAEEVAANDALRYAETVIGTKGSFEIKNLAPGKYWLLARPVPDVESLEQVRPVAWNDVERIKLRREAEATGEEVELKPCQRLEGYLLKVKLP